MAKRVLFFDEEVLMPDFRRFGQTLERAGCSVTTISNVKEAQAVEVCPDIFVAWVEYGESGPGGTPCDALRAAKELADKFPQLKTILLVYDALSAHLGAEYARTSPGDVLLFDTYCRQPKELIPIVGQITEEVE